MASFLRRKTKQSEPTTKALPPVTLSSSLSTPPLFARFSTSAHNNNNVAPRIVSSPMTLASARKDLHGKGGAGRGHGSGASSLSVSSRDTETARRRVHDQAHASQASLNGAMYHSTSTSPRPMSRVVVDKPLPPPVDNDGPSPPLSTSAPAVNRRPPANRGPGPPPTFQTQALRSRTSMDFRDRDHKPDPRPGSAQAYYASPERQIPPPSGYKFTPAVPPKRNASISSVSTAVTPQIGPPITNAYRKMKPPLPPSGKSPLPTTNDALATQSLLPQPSKHPLPAQDFPSNTLNGIGGGESNPRLSQPVLPEIYSTPMSIRGLDLPPEFALFQEYSDAISDTGAPNSTNSRRSPSSSLKVTEQVPGSTILRSGSEIQRGLQRQPSIPQLGATTSNNANFQPSPRPPSPPPLPQPDMGITTSHAMSSELLPSSYKTDFHAPRVLTTTTTPNARSPTYNNNININDVNHQQPRHLPVRANSHSASPPLPPGAARPSNYHSPYAKDLQDAVPPPQATVHSQSFQQQFYPSSVRQEMPSTPYGQASRPSQAQGAPVSLQKSPSILSATAPLRGRPRIFAAMEAQDNDTERPATAPHPIPPPQPPPPQFPEQTPHHHVLSKPHNEATPSQQTQHHHPSPEPLPPAAEFWTPKSRLDPLPPQSHFVNGTADRSSSFSTAPHEQPQPHEPAKRTPRSKTRALPRPEEHLRQQQQQQLQSPQNTPRSRKLSKARNQPDMGSLSMHPNASNVTIPSMSDKGHQHGGHRTLIKPHHQPSMSSQKSLNSHSTTALNSFEPISQVDEDTILKAGIPLDDDPFARVEGVKMMSPAPPPLPTKEGKSRGTKGSPKEKDMVNGSRDDVEQVAGPQRQDGHTPLTPASPEDRRKGRKERGATKSDAAADPPAATVDEVIEQGERGDETDVDVAEPYEPITLLQFLSDPTLLSSMLAFFSFYDWCVLAAVSKEIRTHLVRTKELREVVLESYLRTVGYSRWIWDDPEPLSLSLQDLGDYMRGVSTPSHEYARVSAMYIHSLTIHPNHRDPSLAETVKSLTASTRAYTRVLLRLRAQAEKEASLQSQSASAPPSATSIGGKSGGFSPARPRSASRVSSRAPSPTMSSNSHPFHNAAAMSSNVNINNATSSQTSLTFRSPLFRLRRAPLLRVFVPSAEGDWLSDRSVLECEAECKRAGVLHLLRFGDVVWDVAVGDEGNVGRLVWDGSFLIDLDYTYSTIGDLPKYLPTLAFPPSYFHRVIRTGASNSNPIVHVDLRPWGEEIAMNLQLLQDRVRTETPQGAIHNVVRWVHRSSFSIRPPRGPQRYNNSTRGPSVNGRIPIPDSNNLFIDPGWYGTIVVETEGTNEALADLQERCGPGPFPPRPRGVHHVTQAQMENRKVFRILREKSRPGEIWLKAVGVKERLL